MARSKMADWLQPQGLEQLQQWAEAGLGDRQIAENMGISVSTLRDWKKRNGEIARVLAKKASATDSQVENALLKRALGYSYMETTYERVEDAAGNEKMVVKRQVEKQVTPDLSAQTFWLKNRHPEVWREKPEPVKEKEEIIVELTDD